MKIFLNERTIEFHSAQPENPLATTLVVQYESAEQLKVVWEEFIRYEKFRNFVIADPQIHTLDSSSAFKAFISFFKLIHAAGGLVRNEKGEFLFIHRLVYGDLPKGKIDKKDIPRAGYSSNDSVSARTAAIREVREETGLKNMALIKELTAT